MESLAGERSGLELMLNTEVYERMQGPYTTHGIRVSQNHVIQYYNYKVMSLRNNVFSAH